MKKSKLISLALSTFLIVGCMPLSANAAETNTQIIEIEYMEDGSYFEIIINEDANSSRAYTKSGSKTLVHRNSSGDEQWKYTINATFSYNPGVSSTCTGVSDTYSIQNDNWHHDSNSCWRSGNTAYGTVTMKYKFVGLTTQTITKDLSLSCDSNGNLS